MKVTCPKCGLDQDSKVEFCSRCSTKLGSGGLPTMAFNSSGVATGQLEGAVRPPSKPLAGSLFNLHLVRTGEILPIGGVGEYIVGRVSKGQSILPDVDLEPYQAYKSGVSRLHASIRVEAAAMWITDLGSANGTQVNNQKLNPHEEHALSNNDIVRLGRLSVQVLMGQE